MRIYIIGNDGIALCREATATVNDGEIVVASKRRPAQRQAAVGIVECAARCRKAEEGRRPRGTDQSTVDRSYQKDEPAIPATAPTCERVSSKMCREPRRRSGG